MSNDPRHHFFNLNNWHSMLIIDKNMTNSSSEFLDSSKLRWRCLQDQYCPSTQHISPNFSVFAIIRLNIPQFLAQNYFLGLCCISPAWYPIIVFKYHTVLACITSSSVTLIRSLIRYRFRSYTHVLFLEHEIRSFRSTNYRASAANWRGRFLLRFTSS